MPFEGVVLEDGSAGMVDGEAIAFDDQDEAPCCCEGGGPPDPTSPCCDLCPHQQLCYAARSPNSTCPPEQNVDAKITLTAHQSVDINLYEAGVVAGSATHSDSKWSYGALEPGCFRCNDNLLLGEDFPDVDFIDTGGRIILGGQANACLDPCEEVPSSGCRLGGFGFPTGRASIQAPAPWGAGLEATYQYVFVRLGFHHDFNHGGIWISIAARQGPSMLAFAAIRQSSGQVETGVMLDTNISNDPSLIFDQLDVALDTTPIIVDGCLRGLTMEGGMEFQYRTGSLRGHVRWGGAAVVQVDNISDCDSGDLFVPSRSIIEPRRANGLL